jgi:hypothetical protein
MAHDVPMNVNIDNLVVLSGFGMPCPPTIMIIEDHPIMFPHLEASCSNLFIYVISKIKRRTKDMG